MACVNRLKEYHDDLLFQLIQLSWWNVSCFSGY